MILQIWSRSKPIYGKYLYKGKIHKKSTEFIEIERELYCIRLGLKVLCLVLAVCIALMYQVSFLDAILMIMFYIFIGDVSTIPLYYCELSQIINRE